MIAELLAATLLAASGVVDLHVHCAPDSRERTIDAVDHARMAQQRGWRAIVLKNHNESTAAQAYFVRKAVPGIEVFGAIALNRAVGGVNPAAVEQMVKMKGGYGRMVWLPTFDIAQLPVVRSGAVTPEVSQVLALIASHNLVLATGHAPPADQLVIIQAARAAGVKRIIVTHPLSLSPAMSVDQMKQAAGMGAFLEFTGEGLGDGRRYAATMRGVGMEHCIVTTDFGQPGNPLPADGIDHIWKKLSAAGIRKDEFDRMTQANPARLLGLEEASK